MKISKSFKYLDLVLLHFVAYIIFFLLFIENLLNTMLKLVILQNLGVIESFQNVLSVFLFIENLIQH